MKALTLYQPWATLVAIGAKRIETRSWSTSYRGSVAIHASKNTQFLHMNGVEPFHQVLREAGYPVENGNKGKVITHLPLGSIIAIVDLVLVLPIAQYDQTYHYNEGKVHLDITIPPGEPERSFGDYTPGRFAWILDNVRMLKEPIPCPGMMGLWNTPMGLVHLPDGFSMGYIGAV